MLVTLSFMAERLWVRGSRVWSACQAAGSHRTPRPANEWLGGEQARAIPCKPPPPRTSPLCGSACQMMSPSATACLDEGPVGDQAE